MNDKLIQIGGKSYKQCEIIMLATEKAQLNALCLTASSKLILLDGKDWETVNNVAGFRPQHLYILSSEEIKEGDWCYHPEVGQEYTIVDTRKEGNDRYSKGQHPAQGIFKYKETTNTWYKKCKKIIATTDFSLSHWNGEVIIGNFKSLPRPSDDFIKAFVEKQGKIDKVLVEVICNKLSQCNCTDNYSCLGTKFKVAPDNTITIKPIQEEKAFWSRKEVIKLCMDAMLYSYMDLPENLTPIQGMNKWIEENL